MRFTCEPRPCASATAGRKRNTSNGVVRINRLLSFTGGGAPPPPRADADTAPRIHSPRRGVAAGAGENYLVFCTGFFGGGPGRYSIITLLMSATDLPACV